MGATKIDVLGTGAEGAKMQYARVPGIDKPISRLVMGTMVANRDNMPYVCELFDHFVSIGGNCFDTAWLYGTEATGEWIRLRGNREQVVLISKGAHPGPHGPQVTPEFITQHLVE